MLITKQSLLTGATNTVDIPVTQERLDAWVQNRTLAQDAFPELTADEREFLITGATAAEWAAYDALSEEEYDAYPDN